MLERFTEAQWQGERSFVWSLIGISGELTSQAILLQAGPEVPA
jgi:hypothetical protein